jgi:uncharacterized SAM-binding protein YcdF (DUF218 family)
MFIINKIISPFIVPPGIFILILFATGLWLLYKKKRKIGILNTCIACLMWLLSTQPVSDLFLKGLESGLQIPQNPKGDVIILPSHRIYKDAPDLSGIGYPSGEMLNRMFTAIRLQRKLNIPVIVSGGYISESVYKQNWPRAVKRLISEAGGYPNKIIIENESRNTYENAKNSYLVCQKHDFENPILVTSAYHMKRSVRSFNKFGIRVLPVPTGFKTWKHKKYTWRDYLPKDFENTRVAIHEYIGLMYYKLFY